MREDVSWTVKADFVRQLARRGERADGRPLNEYRPIEVITDYIPHSAGSALVKIGKTQVIAGVSLQAGTPYPDTPDSGVLMTGAELIPLASPEFEPGPPSPQAVELARVVDRGIRESHVIDFDKLCIEPRKAVWMVMLDLHVIDYDGNLFDAGTLASTAALLNTKMLKYEDGLVVKEKTKTKLPMKGKPVECTFAKIGETLMLDPDIGEEHALDARLTLATIDDMFCAAQKGGFGSLTQQDIESAMDLALKKGAELRKLL
jgi:exosome complex component RRP42